ncbi:MAG: alpha/beta fold hydrolase [Bryobacteraceae bacterium]
MNTVIFVHGAWVTPLCWRYFAPIFADHGYRTLIPAWPLKDWPIADQLSCPDRRLARVGISEIVAHYRSVIERQPEPPLLIGHSFGGLIVQLLLDQGLGVAGIAINSVPPRGVPPLRLSPFETARKVWKLFLAPAGWGGILPPPEPDDAEKELRRRQGIETNLVPESRRIFRQLLTRAATVDYRNALRAPLLLVGGGQDRCVPAELQRRNWRRYAAWPARTDFFEFGDLTHLSIAEPGREALAAYCMGWIESLEIGEPEVRFTPAG